MKHSSAIIILYLLVSYNGYSQDEITMQTSFKDDTTYNIAIDKSSHIETNYFGSDSFIIQLRNRGIENPLMEDEQLNAKLTLRTGLSDNSDFPVALELVNIEDSKTNNINTKYNAKRYESIASRNGQTPEIKIPNGTIVNGHCSLNSMPHFDSVPGTALTEAYKNAARHEVRELFKELSFGERKLKQGEKFTRETVVSRRMADVILDLVAVSTYSLSGVSNGVADFDISTEFSVRPGQGSVEFKVEGSGTGNLKYDTVNNVILEHTEDSEVNIAAELQNGRSAEEKITRHYEQTTSLGTN